MNVKRSLSILLAALLCVSLLPGSALAAGGSIAPVPEEGTVLPPELPQYTVCLMGHGGVTDGNASQVSEALDTAGYVLPECPFEREGYTFAGWSADYGPHRNRPARGQLSPDKQVHLPLCHVGEGLHPHGPSR